MKKISVVISVFNEEKKLKDCLESVKWADEIIVVDNESTDKTKEIAKKYTSHIFTQKNNLMLNVNKNFGFTKATGEWILCLDGDERVTKELEEEIKHIVEANPAVAGYWIPRKNIIFGKWMEHTGWYPDFQLRLFKNGKGKFPEEHVHEMITVEGKAEYLQEHLLHLNFETVAQFLHKHITIYAPNEASDLLKKGYVFNRLDAIRFPIKEFLSRFFAREGYKDGFHGLLLSLLLGFYHLVIFSYLWEHNKFVDEGNKNILHEITEEFNHTKKDFTFWIFQERIRNEKNPLKKFLSKFHKYLSS